MLQEIVQNLNVHGWYCGYLFKNASLASIHYKNAQLK